MSSWGDGATAVPVLQGVDDLLLSQPQRVEALVAAQLLTSQQCLSQRRCVSQAL